MHTISVDFGTYSLKIYHCIDDKAGPRLVNLEEYPLAEYIGKDIQEDLYFKEQIKLLTRSLSKLAYEFKLIVKLPSELFTTRFLNLPVKQRKKALLMIPFQLEEEIPYAMSETHLGISLYPKQNSHDALISIIKKDEFEKIFDAFKTAQLSPYIITTEVSIYDYYYRFHFEEKDNFCILDIGHHSTTAYFFNNSKLVATHKTYVAGKNIDEEIIQHYKVKEDEAIHYKHSNAFILTEDQLEKADKDQKVFSNIMAKLFEPLISDFNRWELAYNVNNRKNINKIFITGGTSLIKNLDNYLSQKLGHPVFLLDSISNSNKKNHSLMQEQVSKFNLLNLAAYAYPNRKNLVNMLNGEFTLQGGNTLPLYSGAYVASRVAIFSAVMFIFLVIELFFINSNIKKANKQLGSILQNPILSLTPYARRQAATNPSMALSLIEKKRKEIGQSIKTIQSASQKNNIKPLLLISSLIDFNKFKLLDLDLVSDNEVNILVKNENPNSLKELETILSSNKSMKFLFNDGDSPNTLSIIGTIK